MTVKSFLSSLLLCILSVFFISCAHPGLFFSSGSAFFGWISYLPLFLLLRSSSLKSAPAWGALYGFGRFFLLMHWLFSYNLPALFGISLAMAAETAAICFVCALVHKHFSIFSWLFMPLILLCFEFLRTTGQLGFSYGIIGYSQWKVPLLVASARFFGVWGISFVIMLFASLAAFYADRMIHFAGEGGRTFSIWKKADRAKILTLLFSLLILIISGFFARNACNDTSRQEKNLPLVLIQPDSDPWKNGLDAYAEELQSLMELTDRALSEHPDTRLVVWSETAFVPDIVRHYREGADAGRALLSKRLLSYIDGKNAAFLLGNNHQEKGADGVREYNSALFFEPGKNVLPPEPLVYSKMRLVPFTEQIPYPRFLSFMAKIFASDAHYWSAGKELTIFELDGIRFSSPICFEDTFSSVVKEMCRAGAELIVNLSNDSWSHSLACQNQHLSMAVFRSAENHVPSVRSTASGQTCIIDAGGKILSELEAFKPGYLYGKVSIR